MLQSLENQSKKVAASGQQNYSRLQRLEKEIAAEKKRRLQQLQQAAQRKKAKERAEIERTKKERERAEIERKKKEREKKEKEKKKKVSDKEEMPISDKDDNHNHNKESLFLGCNPTPPKRSQISRNKTGSTFKPRPKLQPLFPRSMYHVVAISIIIIIIIFLH